MMHSLCAGSITAYSLYGPLFLSRLKYSQYQVNLVSTVAEIAMYLPVPLLGYLVDRYNPRPISLLSGLLFGVGYLLAALTYRAGPIRSEGGWPLGVMLLAFIGVGCGTSSMYLSAVTTCAKNFGRGKHKGIALAVPIAAFGLSGMWQSQVGSHLLSRPSPDGHGKEVDVYRYFLFLAGLLFTAGVVGSLGLRVVDEDALLENAIEDLERSGLLHHHHQNGYPSEHSILHDSDYPSANGYGTISRSSSAAPSISSLSDNTKKKWLANASTRLFLSDPTMWCIACAFFLLTGPGETYINNLGTVVTSLYPPSAGPIPRGNTPATHVSIVAVSSTIARIATGVLSDLFGPSSSIPSSPFPHFSQHQKLAAQSLTLPRPLLLLFFILILLISEILLASPLSSSSPSSTLPAVSALVGTGYGAIFSLTPIIISAVWGVRNFGTNWGIVAVVPAAGAALWGAVYSAVYARHVDVGDGEVCYGRGCYEGTVWGWAASSVFAAAMVVGAWQGWNRRGLRI